MKDNFSEVASKYSEFRPHYPDEMIAYIASFTNQKKQALDLATGNGQVAKMLSQYFEKVYATDVSASQIGHSQKAVNISYRVERAEKTGFAAHQFDLITVAQAIHWFDFEPFYEEVSRILKPDGIFAVLGYGLFSTNPASDLILRDFYYNIVGPYWDAERKYLDQMYRTIPFPFDEVPVRSFESRFHWTFQQLTGYLETWSATQHYKNAKSENPVDIIRGPLQASWENSNKAVVFPLLLRIGRLKTQKTSP